MGLSTETIATIINQPQQAMSDHICHICMIHCFEGVLEKLCPPAGISPATCNSKAVCCFVMYMLRGIVTDRPSTELCLHRVYCHQCRQSLNETVRQTGKTVSQIDDIIYGQTEADPFDPESS